MWDYKWKPLGIFQEKDFQHIVFSQTKWFFKLILKGYLHARISGERESVALYAKKITLHDMIWYKDGERAAGKNILIINKVDVFMWLEKLKFSSLLTVIIF
jgi:hypothetical protein